jgi:monoterpene epsilon-lactone hydrolase
MTTAQRARINADLRSAPPVTGGVDQLREGFARFMSTMALPAGTVTTETGLGGRRAVLVERERDPGTGTILYLHGGSHVFGSPETAMVLTSNLVLRTGFRSYSLDYRLAPEHPFPADVEDCLAAYRALLDQGADPDTVVLAGDSAGGGLVVTTLLAARDAGLPLPAAGLALSGGFDASRTGESMRTKVGIDPIFTPAGLGRTGPLYVGDADVLHPWLSPAVTADLAGLPPLMLQVGTDELLLDDSTRLAARARDAGVDVVLDVTAGVPHVFQSWAGVLDEADDALDRAAFFLGQRLGRR